MNSETSMVAADFRLQEQAAQIRECQSRPVGMSGVDWCTRHGITFQSPVIEKAVVNTGLICIDNSFLLLFHKFYGITSTCFM